MLPKKRLERKTSGFVLDHSSEAFLDLKSETSSVITIFQHNLTAPSHSRG